MALEKYLGQDLIIWNYVNEQQLNRSYAYPKCMIDGDDKITYLSVDDFPESGAIQINLTNNTTTDFFEDYGNIMVMRVNKPLPTNSGLSYTNTNKYIARANSMYNELDKNDVSFIPLSYFDLREVIKTNWTIEEISRKREITISSPSTKEIFLEIGGNYYGPFDTDRVGDNQVKLKALLANKYNIGEFNPKKIELYVADITDRDESPIKKYITPCGTGDILSHADRKIDFIDDVKLAEYMMMILELSDNHIAGIGSETFSEMKDVLDKSFRENQTVYLTKDRLNRIIGFISRLESIPESVDNISQSIFNNANLKDEITEYIIEHKLGEVTSLLINNPNASEIITNKLGIGATADGYQTIDLNSEIQELKSEIWGLKNDNEALKNDNEALKNDNLALAEKTLDISGIPNEIKKQIEENEILLGTLKKKIDDARQEYEQLVSYKRDVAHALKETVNNFKNDATVIGKAADKFFLKEVISVIEGIEIEYDEEVKIFDEKLIRRYETAEELIKNVEEYIVKRAGRIMSRNEIINLIICITNGFITTFAGKPGTGKTSLCNIIARAFGLAREDENKRFVQVAVERGWTSQKDYIGYYNPLSKRFETTNYEMMDAIRTIDFEASQNIENAPFFVLLDEANLSPIEHYWAGFNRICDTKCNADRTISLGGKKTWQISSSLRFLATINFDHTTEELSPRFLDRTWVIMLKPAIPDFEHATLDDADIDNEDSVVSMKDLNQFFTPNKVDKLNETLMAKLQEILSAFDEAQLSVSSRNTNSVIKYCLVAQKYMKENKYSALDFAVSQKLLPTINGYGTNYEKLVNDLEHMSEKTLPLCQATLKRMKENAAMMADNYQFF